MLFLGIVFTILGIVCASIYYFSYSSRLEFIKKRLTNRSMTTARLLTHAGIFDRSMVERIDSLTTLTLKDKMVVAYDEQNRLMYNYTEKAGASFPITEDIIKATREKGSQFYEKNDLEVITVHYREEGRSIVMGCAADDEDGKTNLQHLKNILYLSFFGGNLIAVIGGYIFSGRLLQPVTSIATEVKNISAYNLSRRIEIGHSRDEWSYLAGTFNDLLNRLQESFEVQRRFISNASHELSTPLTSISSQIEIALQRERSEEEYRRILSSLLQDARHMNKLTQTLLEFASASGDKGGLNIDLSRIDELIMELPASLRKQNSAYHVSLQFGEFPQQEDELLFLGNRELLFTAIRNIVTNACKYSNDHRATVTLQIQGTYFEIKVQDDGIGIAEKDIPNLFQPFYRADKHSGREGFGLGLSLAYRIIKLHKGEVLVESKEGHGSVFTVRIPTAKRGNEVLTG